MRGKLIAVEGLDKAGKSTQCARLVDNLKKHGHDVLHMRFPGASHSKEIFCCEKYVLMAPDRTTPIGKMIDAYLKGASEIEDHAIHLLFSANRWEAV
jgi:dTMP kinase